MIRTIDRCLLELYRLPKPTVAAINGHLFAAGFVLALACDVRLAAIGGYRLGVTEVGVGVPFPAVPLLVVQSELDASTVRNLLLSGRTFDLDDPVALQADAGGTGIRRRLRTLRLGSRGEEQQND